MTNNRGQFRKGQSGNPKGRPARQQTLSASGSAFDVVVERTLAVTRNGVRREITMEEALQDRTYQDALAGKRMARREVLKWIERREAWMAKRQPTAGPTIQWLEPEQDPSNADAAMLILGIADHNPARADLDRERAQLLLEPWAVELALRRRRTAKALTQNEIDEIRRCTRDVARVRLPKAAVE